MNELEKVQFDQDLIRRYDKAGPRYTSYPTAVEFTDTFTIENYKEAARQSNETKKALSLYFHLPFCDTVCFYCACNKIVTKHRERAKPYLDRLHQEIEMQAQLFSSDRIVEQLHWGGGTPTFISHDEMSDLMAQTKEYFHLSPDGEYSIEIDPREVDSDTLYLLRDIGFNRLSLGVQDLNPQVQKAVNRIQSASQTFDTIRVARESGFKSVSIDLIYGLPYQTLSSFSQTIDRILDVQPDRISIFNYAHLPDRFKPQRRIRSDDLPSPQEKLVILEDSINRLQDAGYVYIGMDHFAKPDDELAIAQREGTLYRNFQGYSTHSDCDLVAMGITSIGMVADTYSQNVRTEEEYFANIDEGKIPVFRGLKLNRDDLLRRSVITALICNFYLKYEFIENEYSIDFFEYFSREIDYLRLMEADGLLAIDSSGIAITPAGRLLIRNICMVFDVYLAKKLDHFSKVI